MTLRALAALGALLVLSGTGAVRAASVSIEARAAPYVFAPESRTIAVGDTVVWVMLGEPHTVTSGTIDAGNIGHPDGRFDSGTRLAGDQYSLTFSEAGTFPYFCIVHADSRMAGTIVVAAAPTPTLPPTPGPTAPPTPAPTARPTAAPPATPTAASTSSATPSPTPTATAAQTASPTPTAPATPTASPTTVSPSASRSAVPSAPDDVTTPASADALPLVLGGLLAIVVLGAAGAVYVARRRGGT